MIWSSLPRGYRVTFPFLDEGLIMGPNGKPKLCLNAFHPEYDSFFVMGLIQPNSGQWGITDYQAQLMAKFIGAHEAGSSKANWFREFKRREDVSLSGGIEYVDTPRHALEVEYFSYKRQLQKLLRRFD